MFKGCIFLQSTLTYSVDNINNQGVQELFADILFEASSLSRCDDIPTITESPAKEDMLDANKMIEGYISKILTIKSNFCQLLKSF